MKSDTGDRKGIEMDMISTYLVCLGLVHIKVSRIFQISRNIVQREMIA
ncbi:hypothetical protein M7I_8183 [Glarea lozoyensis 74030]|uniref:Uncharacterized protein n=1 Tax=Glarea lozoyensis (strain ATCC 74030 / MF5533) TaxID=1104152 RepID=H0EZC0_GLAL7|nr:hypothetical protein M7I_8183 [Glarea lozoyensis 74030]